jgi:hypothetical protein
MITRLMQMLTRQHELAKDMGQHYECHDRKGLEPLYQPAGTDTASHWWPRRGLDAVGAGSELHLAPAWE